MSVFASFLFPMAFLFPFVGADVPTALATAPGDGAAGRGGAEMAGSRSGVVGPLPLGPVRRARLEGALAPVTARQVRIEQRIILRVAPRSPEMERVLAEMQQRAPRMRFEERKAGKCVAMRSLVGVRAGSDDRLVLYTRDGTMLSARLKGNCSARDFYSGFYVEPDADGRICVGRDDLQSRNGVSCQLSSLHRLVPVQP